VLRERRGGLSGGLGCSSSDFGGRSRHPTTQAGHSRGRLSPDRTPIGRSVRPNWLGARTMCSRRATVPGVTRKAAP
jgi:hypothetical protein